MSRTPRTIAPKVEELRASHDAIQERLAVLDQRILLYQDSAFNEEVRVSRCRCDRFVSVPIIFLILRAKQIDWLSYVRRFTYWISISV